MNQITIFITILFTLFSGISLAATNETDAQIKKPNYPIIPYYNFNHPRTRDEVLNAYPWRVDVKNGVDAIEARIMAQYEMVIRDLDNDFEIAKVKIIKEDLNQFIVQVPTKISLSKKTAFRYLITIDKKNGKIKSMVEDFKGPIE